VQTALDIQAKVRADVADVQTPSPETPKKYWWTVGIAVPIIVALIGLWGQWHKQEANPAASPPVVVQQASGGPSVFVRSLPVIGFVLGAGIVAGIVVVLTDDLPAPVLFLFATFGAAFAIWAAISTTSDPPKRPLLVMIFLALSGISMLGFGIACYWRELRLGTYIGCCAAVAAAVYLIVWEIGSDGGWITDGGTISSEAAGPHICFAVLVTLGVIFSGRNALAWISLALAGLSFFSTIGMDSNGRDGHEASPLGLIAFLAAMVMVHFALRGEDVYDLPDWVRGCLEILRRFGGWALIGLGIFGMATNKGVSSLDNFGNYYDPPLNDWWDGAALGVGLLALLIARSMRSRRSRF